VGELHGWSVSPSVLCDARETYAQPSLIPVRRVRLLHSIQGAVLTVRRGRRESHLIELGHRVRDGLDVQRRVEPAGPLEAHRLTDARCSSIEDGLDEVGLSGGAEHAAEDRDATGAALRSSRIRGAGNRRAHASDARQRATAVNTVLLIDSR